jgi:hypothetical protein
VLEGQIDEYFRRDHSVRHVTVEFKSLGFCLWTVLAQSERVKRTHHHLEPTIEAQMFVELVEWDRDFALLLGTFCGARLAVHEFVVFDVFSGE